MSPTRVTRDAVRYVKNGEPVDAGVANRPVRDLQGNLAAITEVVEAMKVGRSILLNDQTVAASLIPGQPVYFDAASSSWKPAQATLLQSGQDAGTWSYGPESFVGGILESKVGTRGAVTLVGELTLPGSWASQAFDGSFSAGPVYLSRGNPGKLSTEGSLSVRVGMASGPSPSGEYTLLVMPSSREALTAHSHLKVPLVAEPAGTPNRAPEYYEGFLVGDLYEGGVYPDFTHQVLEVDRNAAGWLPASDTTFSGLNIPTGAKFGYNIAADSNLVGKWPPSPAYFAKSAVITLDGGIADEAQVIANASGIWWMTDDYGKAPWSVNYRPYFEAAPSIVIPESGTSEESSTPSSSSSSESLPLRQPKIILWYNSVVSQTETTFVSAITSVDGSVLVREPSGGVLDVSADVDYAEQVLKPVSFYPTALSNQSVYADPGVWTPVGAGNQDDILRDAAIPCVVFKGQNSRAYYAVDVSRLPVTGGSLALSVRLRVAPEAGPAESVAPVDGFSVLVQVIKKSALGSALPTSASAVQQLTWSAASLQLPITSTSYVDIETDAATLAVDKDSTIAIVVRQDVAGGRYLLDAAARVTRV